MTDRVKKYMVYLEYGEGQKQIILTRDLEHLIKYSEVHESTVT